MKWFLLFTLLISALQAAPDAINPKKVGIIYNSTQSESAKLAHDYAKVRNIPEENLIGLKLPTKGTITREEYNTLLRDPLRKHFTQNSLWALAASSDGLTSPTTKAFDILICMRGVPFRISRTPKKEGEPKPKQKIERADEASVDSELALIGIKGLPVAGPLQNQYFDKRSSFEKAKLPFLFLVGRLDGPSWDDCHRMYEDALEVEKTGLWGLCYIDLSGKYPLGDQWLRTIAAQNALEGIPYIVDENKDTFPAFYPMQQAALYYGWYAQERNGPLLNPDFRFKKGAVAMHLHSFSGSQLRKKNKKWSGPIIAAGAAATIGNVYEPYLNTSHHFDKLHNRLLAGYSLIEAAYMSIPVLSWQGMVIGDPLYRPFKHLEKVSGEATDEDKPYRIIRAATGQWGNKEDVYFQKVRGAAAKLGSPELYEHLGLRAVRNADYPVAQAFFLSAAQQYPNNSPDQLRQHLHIVDMARQTKIIPQAIEKLKKLKSAYPNLPEAKAVTSLLTILDPPPPPPAKPAQATPAAKK